MSGTEGGGGSDPAKAVALSYAGVPIGTRNEMLCLTDMWRAAGEQKNREPYEWARYEGAPFINFIAENLNTGTARVLLTERGRHGGTWAHWQIGLAYAKYLSPKFHAWCNEVVRAHMEGQHQSLSAVMTELKAMGQELHVHRKLLTDIREHQQRTDRYKRKEISGKTKKDHLFIVNRLGGRCPCCSQSAIVSNNELLKDSRGPLGQFDHFYSPDNASVGATWLICRACHLGLSTGRVDRYQRRAAFDHYQTCRKELFTQTSQTKVVAVQRDFADLEIWPLAPDTEH